MQESIRNEKSYHSKYQNKLSTIRAKKYNGNTKQKRKRQRTVYECPICKGPVIIELLNPHMMIVVCKSCNAVYDYYDPLDEKEIYNYDI